MKKVAIVAAVQVLAILAWAGREEAVRASATSFRVLLAPRSPFEHRGRHLVLRLAEGDLSPGAGSSLSEEDLSRLLGTESSFRGRARVGFCPAGETWRVCAVDRLDAPGREGAAPLWSLALVRASAPDRKGGKGSLRVDLGFRERLVSRRALALGGETEAGWELELGHRPGRLPLPLRLWRAGRSFEIG